MPVNNEYIRLNRYKRSEYHWIVEDPVKSTPIEKPFALDLSLNLARREFHKQHPELQVDRWDCGWRQLKGLFAEACPEQLNDLKAKFKILRKKMEPKVFELGFLKS